MKLLLDENLPVKLKFRFTQLNINAFTVKDMKWLGKGNGDLLKLMLENGFDCFITIDNNLSFQNNYKNYPISVIVLIAPDNTYNTIMEVFDKVLGCLRDDFKGIKTVVHNNFAPN